MDHMFCADSVLIGKGTEMEESFPWRSLQPIWWDRESNNRSVQCPKEVSAQLSHVLIHMYFSKQVGQVLTP